MKFKVVLLFVLVFLISGCVNEKKEKSIEKKEYKVVKVYDLKNSGFYQQHAKFPAQIYSLQETKMAFEVSGKIVKFYYDEGDFVKKGSIIAKLDDTILRANYNSVLSSYKQANLDYKRYKKLYQSRSIAKREFEQIKYNLDVIKAKLRVAKKNLQETKLVAEFSGVLAKKLVRDYARIVAKQPVLILQDNAAYKVKFFVPESDILEVKERISEENASKLVDFFVTIGNLKQEIPAKFIDISTTAEEISRTFEVTLKIDKLKNRNIFSGMTANVEVIEKQKHEKKSFIPANALFDEVGKGTFVWVVDSSNKVSKKEVQLGSIEKDKVEIKSGLEGVSRIVISGIRFLNENDKIKIYQKIR